MRNREQNEVQRECVSSSKPHVTILLGKTGMQQDEKQMWCEERRTGRERKEWGLRGMGVGWYIDKALWK